MKSEPQIMRKSRVLQPIPSATPPPRGVMRPQRQPKPCPLCKQARRSDIYHFLRECRHLPKEDRKYIVRARQIANICDNRLEELGRMTPYVHESESNDVEHTPDGGPEPSALRIRTRQSPYMDILHAHQPVRITLDSGVTGNMICQSVASRPRCNDPLPVNNLCTRQMVPSP